MSTETIFLEKYIINNINEETNNYIKKVLDYVNVLYSKNQLEGNFFLYIQILITLIKKI